MNSEEIKVAINVGLLAVALFGILYLATKYGFIHCSVLPHWCGIYRSINTAVYGRVYPSVIILYGDSGLGDPKFLEQYIRKVCRYHVRSVPVGYVSLGNLQSYDVVIVEHARKMSAAQLEMLWDFVSNGGKLVLIGDSGVEAPNPEEYLTWKELGEENKEGIVNPWDRVKEDGTTIQFGTYLLGLKFYGVGGEENEISGEVKFEDDILTEGLPISLDLKTRFAATKPLNSSVFGPQLIDATIVNTGKVNGAKPPFPAVMRIGYRIVYLAYPPELSGKGHLLLYFNLCRVIT